MATQTWSAIPEKNNRKLLNELRYLECLVQFRYIPAHFRVLGNEAADWVAKKLAGCDPDMQTHSRPPLELDSLYTVMRITRLVIRKAIRCKRGCIGRNEARQSSFNLVHGGESPHVGTHRPINSAVDHTNAYGINRVTIIPLQIPKAGTNQHQCCRGQKILQSILLECRE